MSHSKRNTSLAFFTSHERSLLKSTWGSQATRLSRDSFVPFASCQLCLQLARDPVACASNADIFCRECIVSNLLAQRKEIKRLEKEDARRRKEEDEAKRARGEEEKGRAVEEFERVIMGMDGAVKKGPNANQAGSEVGAEKIGGRGVKRKFELDEDEMLKNAMEERAKARKALDEEKAGKPNLPSFWVPSLTPSSANNLPVKPAKLSPLCPASSPGHSHPLSLKNLVSINFNTSSVESPSRSAPEPASLICPACNKGLSNSIKAVLTIPCGHVLCKPCAAKFMSPATDSPDPHESAMEQRDHNRILCYVCEADLTGEGAGIGHGGKGTLTPGLVQIKSEGTGFAGGGKNMATREGVAFQC